MAFDVNDDGCPDLLVVRDGEGEPFGALITKSSNIILQQNKSGSTCDPTTWTRLADSTADSLIPGFSTSGNFCSGAPGSGCEGNPQRGHSRDIQIAPDGSILVVGNAIFPTNFGTACAPDPTCNDNDPCTDDYCDPNNVCQHINNRSYIWTRSGSSWSGPQPLTCPGGIVPENLEVFALTIADFDHDGDADLFLATNRGMRVAKNNSGSFVDYSPQQAILPVEFSSGGSCKNAVVAGDIDGNSILEALVAVGTNDGACFSGPEVLISDHVH